MTPVTIRVSSAGDYAAVVAIHNLIHPERATAIESLVESDRRRDPRLKHQRWVAVQDARVVGYAQYIQHVYDYHPEKFHIELAVLPDCQQRGIGAALYERLIAGLALLGARKLRADGYENLPEGPRFLRQRGFREVFRETPLHLEVLEFDPAPFAYLERELGAQGVKVLSLRELEGDPDRDRKTYDLYWEVSADVPREDRLVVMSFHEWAKWTLEDPSVPHEGYLIAVCGDEYVGIAEFGQSPGGGDLQGGLVGVKRSFRRRGVATAMHVRAIAYAREHAYARIVTSTAEANVAMRALYERLGFVRQPDWIQMEKVLSGV